MSGLRETHVTVSLQDNATSGLNHINHLIDLVESSFQNLGGGINDSTNDMDSLVDSVDDLSDSIDDAGGDIDDLSDHINDADNNMDDLADGTNDVGNEIEQAEKKAGFFGSTLGKVVGVLATAFAVDRIADFGMGLVEAAAETKAMSAQFEQVFDGIEEKSTETLNKIAKDTGMLPKRLKGSFTQISAFAKTTGMDTADSLALTERATLAAADSAAFYDKSIEDVADSIQSFLKGNFENDAALGISATETTRNAKANELYSKSFNKLSESQKQLTLLAMVEDGNKLSGALGQAAKESDSFENQMGNWKQTWNDLKATVGVPLLQPFVDSLMDASIWMQNLDTDKLVAKVDRAAQGFGAIKNTIMSLIYDTGEISDIWRNFGLPEGTANSIESFAEYMKTGFTTAMDVGGAAFGGIKDGFNWMVDNKEIVISAVAGVAGGFAALKVIGIVTGLINAYKTSAFIATITTQGFNAALKANPIRMVITAIGLLVAAGVYLYQNWDTVKVKAGELWATTKEVFGGIYDWGMNKIQPVTGFFKGLGDRFNDFKSAISNFKLPGWVSSIGSTLSGAANKVGGLIDGSHATGLASVPFDGYRAELHKDESVLTADQSNALRNAGILSSNGDGTPNLNIDSKGGGSGGSASSGGNKNTLIFQISGSNPEEIARQVKAQVESIFGGLIEAT